MSPTSRAAAAEALEDEHDEQHHEDALRQLAQGRDPEDVPRAADRAAIVRQPVEPGGDEPDAGLATGRRRPSRARGAPAVAGAGDGSRR